MVNKKVEEYFFKYAFPCLFVKLYKKEITEEDYRKIEEQFKNGRTPEKSELENLFPAAFRRIKRLAERTGKDYWDSQVMREYWMNEHNRIIDNKEESYADTPQDFNDLCKVHKAEVLSIKEGQLKVKYNGKERKVSSLLVPDVKLGDIVTVHFSYAIEKI